MLEFTSSLRFGWGRKISVVTGFGSAPIVFLFCHVFDAVTASLLLRCIFRNRLCQIILDFGGVALHFIVCGTQQLILTVAQGLADGLLHPGVAQVALSGCFLRDHLENTITFLGMDDG